MIIKELLGYDDLRKQFDYDPLHGQTKTKWNISDYLTSYGWFKKGSGIRGTVYWKKGTEYVLKIFSNDDCYVKFIDFIKQHNNPHFPKIYGVLKFPKFRNLYAVKLEILTPLLRQEFEKNIGLHLYIQSKINNRHSFNILKIEKGKERFFPYILDKFKKENKSLCDALDLLFNHFNSNCAFDIHYQNIMKRSDGTLVIIDPVESTI